MNLQEKIENKKIANAIAIEAYSILDYLSEQERNNYNTESAAMTADLIINAALKIKEKAKKFIF